MFDSIDVGVGRISARMGRPGPKTVSFLAGKKIIKCQAQSRLRCQLGKALAQQALWMRLRLMQILGSLKFQLYFKAVFSLETSVEQKRTTKVGQ